MTQSVFDVRDIVHDGGEDVGQNSAGVSVGQIFRLTFQIPREGTRSLQTVAYTLYVFDGRPPSIVQNGCVHRHRIHVLEQTNQRRDMESKACTSATIAM